jgi:small-conductance mechanosensitive channel
MMGQATTTSVPNPAAGLVEGVTNLDEACGNHPSWACRVVFDRTGNETLAGAAEWFVAKPLAILAVVLAALVASRLLRSVIKRVMLRMLEPTSSSRLAKLRERTPNLLLRTTEEWSLRSAARVQTLTAVARSLASLIVWFIAVVWILDILELNFGPFIAGAGIIGVALGFGAQNIVRDFLSGFFLIIEDQFGVGDIVDLGEASGTVEKVTLRSTRLRDVHGVVWHVPNGQIQRVANQSQEWARALLDVEVAYDTDIDLAERVIAETAEAMAADPAWALEILETPEVWGIEAFTPNAIVIRLVMKTRPASQWRVMRELRKRLKEAFDQRGIVIPVAQLDLRMHRDRDGQTVDDTSGSGEGPVDGEQAPAEATERDEA